MANSCVQLSGFLLGFLGWLGIIIATATNDWVHTCHHGMSVCKMMDDYRAMGPWANCVLRAGNSHCQSLTQIFDLPVYIQTTRALMIIASILGLPAAGILLMSMPCINLGNDLQSSKNKRAILGGVLLLLVGLCGLVSTIWFPYAAFYDQEFTYFGFSLYTGWVGTVFCLLGGAILACSSDSSPPSSRPYQENNRFNYSKQGGGQMPAPSTTNHAKSAHV
ncbi:claudin-11 [Oryzias latipes]|uniref:Claudin 11a n=2 Tax=Oryzias latipes TaxID=8090 RepID=H2M795_ORYLA|nr:claudin-11 [Oryzias latipes]